MFHVQDLDYPFVKKVGGIKITNGNNKNKNGTTRDEVEWRDCCSLHAVTSSVIYYSTHARKNVIYLFYTIKIQMVF